MDVSQPSGGERLGGHGRNAKPNGLATTATDNGDMGPQIVLGPQSLGLPMEVLDIVEQLTQSQQIDVKPGDSPLPIPAAAHQLSRRRKYGDLPEVVALMEMATQRGQDIDGMQVSGDRVGELLQPGWGDAHSEVQSAGPSPAMIEIEKPSDAIRVT